MHRSIIALLLAALSAPSWSQSTVGFDLSGGSTFSVGSTVTLTLEASNFAGGLEGGGVDLQFNSAVLSLESVAINPAFDQSSSKGFAPVQISNKGAGSTATGVDFFAFFNSPPVGTFDIATFKFLADGTGTTNLNLSEDAVFGPFLNGVSSPLNLGTDYKLINSSATVSSMVPPVPEPPTFWLIAAVGLLALSARGWITRRSTNLFG
jgi:hypothetical protein